MNETGFTRKIHVKDLTLYGHIFPPKEQSPTLRFTMRALYLNQKSKQLQRFTIILFVDQPIDMDRT